MTYVCKHRKLISGADLLALPPAYHLSWGNSDAQILKFKIEDEKILSLYSSAKENLGDQGWALSRVMEGITPQKVFSIRLNAAKKILYHGIAQIEGFKPVVAKSDYTEQGNLLDLGAETMLTSDLSRKNLKTRGTWTKNNVSLEWDNTKHFYYVQPTNPSGVARSVSHHKNGRLSLRLRGYKVTTRYHGVLLDERDFNEEDDVLRVMGTVRNPYHVKVCSWKKGKGVYYYGGLNNGDLKVEKASSSESFVFLLIRGFTPSQKMV
ncbi:hypothetical protein LCI18_006811 [Fusarium solani-melongenae]|uniref:Uncharacterized protein n=1 Tax=Fusarium solani subsp. cucurbitae TaxID=2747967 RepID=A0ACD3Z3V3_FUSSC|nr:hypothetical protein LCI18_006811 [Fusarium solani-melongenae]